MTMKLTVQGQILRTLVDVVKRIMPRYAKVVSGDGPDPVLLREATDSVPGLRWLWRCYEQGQPIPGNLHDAEWLAREYARKILDAEAVKLGLVWGVEAHSEGFAYGYNLSDVQCAYLDHYNIVLMDLLAEGGVECVAFNFGTGNGDALWYIARFPKTLERYVYLGFQEYSWPNMDTAAGSYVLRYRDLMETLIDRGDTHHRAIVTEGGITQAVAGGPDHGYRTIKTADEFWGDLSWTNGEVCKDTYFEEFIIFGAGMEQDADDHDRWGSFDVAGTVIVDRMAAVGPRVPDGGNEMAEYKLGFKDLADRLGLDVVGNPQADEQTVTDDDGDQITVQPTDKPGLMVYVRGGQPIFLPGKA